MATPSRECTLEEQHAVVRFLSAHGVSGTEIYSMIIQYGRSCMNRRNIYKRIERFQPVSAFPVPIGEQVFRKLSFTWTIEFIAPSLTLYFYASWVSLFADLLEDRIFNRPLDRVTGNFDRLS